MGQEASVFFEEELLSMILIQRRKQSVKGMTYKSFHHCYSCNNAMARGKITLLLSARFRSIFIALKW
jgi:hypothetical protein